MHVNLVALSPEFRECGSQLEEVQEPMNVVISQDGLEMIHELNFKSWAKVSYIRLLFY
jgi:hypothetical protein